MDAVSWICLVAAIATLLPAWFGPDDAWVLSLLNVVACLTTMFAWSLDQLGTLPVLDLLIALLAWVLAASQGATAWRMMFMSGAVIQVGLDAWYGVVGEAFYQSYAVLYNAAFGVELVALASSGGANAWRRLWDFFSDFRRPLCPAREA